MSEITVLPEPTEQKPQPKSDFVSERELLERIPICRRTLYACRQDGRIPYVKLGKRVLFHLPSVEAAILRQQRAA